MVLVPKWRTEGGGCYFVFLLLVLVLHLGQHRYRSPLSALDEREGGGKGAFRAHWELALFFKGKGKIKGNGMGGNGTMGEKRPLALDDLSPLFVLDYVSVFCLWGLSCISLSHLFNTRGLICVMKK